MKLAAMPRINDQGMEFWSPLAGGISVLKGTKCK